MMTLPIHLINQTDHVLCLFAAAFHGENDVQHLYNAGCRNVILIDNDRNKLNETAKMFGYSAICFDIIECLKYGGSFGKYDVIISDHWTGDMEEFMDKNIDRLKSMARKYLIYTTTKTGQPGEYFLRSDYNGGVYWRVIPCK